MDGLNIDYIFVDVFKILKFHDIYIFIKVSGASANPCSEIFAGRWANFYFNFITLLFINKSNNYMNK